MDKLAGRLLAEFLEDGSTGITWTRHDLAMARDTIRGVRERGEWNRYASEPFAVDRPGPVTVWIRFNYVNENQFLTRWQVDDVAIERASAEHKQAVIKRDNCSAPAAPLRMQVFCGDQDSHLVRTKIL